ncbi:winged helix DNA-binding protein [Lutibacter sp. B2]|nr:winged helix DNA-binding protein [Lutibacter sp. B2]
MGNYYNEINIMVEKLMHKILVYDRKGFKIGTKSKELSLLDVYVLKAIGEEKEKKIYELLEEVEMDRGMVASIIKKLVLYAYVRKERSEDDKRAYILSLTEKGMDMYNKTLEIQENFLEFILSDITLNEEKAILKFLSKINQTTLK